MQNEWIQKQSLDYGGIDPFVNKKSIKKLNEGRHDGLK